MWKQQSRPAEAGRVLLYGLIGGLVVYGLVKMALWFTPGAATATDYSFVMSQAERIRSGGPFYQPWELTSEVPRGVWADLYPPTTVALLFLPMSFAPALLWWLVPLGITGAVIWHHRPSLEGLALILALLVLWPYAMTTIQLGNPSMWIVAALALGTVRPWAFALVVVKPTFAPFALLGVRDRRWWLVAIGLGLVSLALLPVWMDYLRVLSNVRGITILYSAHDWAIVAIPFVAWRTSRR